MDKETLIDKLTSRKLWLSIAAVLASVGTAIAGTATGNEAIATCGIVCTVLAAGIYAAAEAYVDGQAAQGVNCVAVACEATEDGEEEEEAA